MMLAWGFCKLHSGGSSRLPKSLRKSGLEGLFMSDEAAGFDVGRKVFYGDQVYKLQGEAVAEGAAMPAFTLWQFLDSEPHAVTAADLCDLHRPVLFSVMHSVDTPVGATQARRIEALLAEFSELAVLGFLVSADLPFTLNRFLREQMFLHTIGASDYRQSFSQAMGVAMKEVFLPARSIFVFGEDGLCVHAEVVSEITHEPDYAAVGNALLEASGRA
jgi:thiol peroxidase